MELHDLSAWSPSDRRAVPPRELEPPMHTHTPRLELSSARAHAHESMSAALRSPHPHRGDAVRAVVIPRKAVIGKERQARCCQLGRAAPGRLLTAVWVPMRARGDA